MYDLFLLAKELGSFGSAAWISKGRMIQNGIFLLFYKVETMARKRRQVSPTFVIFYVVFGLLNPKNGKKRHNKPQIIDKSTIITLLTKLAQLFKRSKKYF